LSLDVLLLVNLGTQCINVSDNSCVDEVDECIIDESAIDGTGVEDGDVSVFDARRVEVGVRVSASMQSHAIDRITLLATSLNSHAISD
jgi:hypothetical protein